MKNKWKEMLASYGIVFGIILTAYLILGIYPFGKYMILKADLLQSYAPVFNDFKEKLLAGDSILYSWNGSMGSHLFMDFATALASPFNIIMLLFPRVNLTESIALLLLLKLPCAAASFCYFITEKLGKKPLSAVTGSVFYALCAYVTALYWNIMWMDAVILLPLVALGLERLVRQGKGLLYSVSLTAILLINYGTALFLCDFSVVYFIILLITENNGFDWKKTRQAIKRFLIRSLLAGGTAAVFLLPVWYSLQSTHYVEGRFAENIRFYNSIGRFLVNQFWGMHPTALVYSDSVPNIYCGVLTILALPLFYMNREIPRKKKVCYSVFLGILFLCFDVNLLTFLVHGMHFPAMMPHRFSFIWSFLLILMAAETFSHREGIRDKRVALTGIGLLAVILLLAWRYPQSEVLKPAKFSHISVAVNLLLVFLYTLYWFLYKKLTLPNAKKVVAGLLLLTVTAEAGSNACLQFSHMNDGLRESYLMEFNPAMVRLAGELNNETEFYRAEFKHYNTLSDGMLYNYKGVNAFAGYPVGAMRLLDNLGLTASYNLLLLTNPTPLVSSILNVKYLLNRGNRMQETFTTYRFKKQVDNVFVYENPWVLPLGFMVSEEINDWKTGETANPFSFQNDFAAKAAGSRRALFSDLKPTTYHTEKIGVTPFGDSLFNYKIPEEVTEDMKPAVTLCYKAPESGHTYVHIRTGGATAATVSVNGRDVLRQAMRQPATALDAGYVDAGGQIEVKLVMNQKTKDEKEELIRQGQIQFYAAQMDEEEYQRVCGILARQPWKISYYDNVTLKGNVDVKEEGLLFTSIPSDKNWRITVDGKRVTMTKIGGGLIGVKLYKGNHEVEFSYHERGLAAGGLISLVSLALLLIFEWLEGKKRKSENEAG